MDELKIKPEESPRRTSVASMLNRILPFMRCPRCEGTELRPHGDGLLCEPCKECYPLRDGILDFVGDNPAEVITPFQRVMQSPLIVTIYERFWRRLGYFIASSRLFEKEIETILRLQRDRDAERILDIACGTGVFTRPLARRTGGLVVGLDLSWPMLRHAQRLMVRDRLPNVLLMRGTAFKLPFIASAFPAINCCGALHLFDQPGRALQEIVRVLHATGHLSVQTTIRPGHSGGIAWFLEHFIRFGFFDEMGLREQLRRHGLKILEWERHRISYSFLARHIS